MHEFTTSQTSLRPASSVMLTNLSVDLSGVPTLGMPLASMSKETSIYGAQKEAHQSKRNLQRLLRSSSLAVMAFEHVRLLGEYIEETTELNFSKFISSLHRAFHDQCIGPVDQKLIGLVKKPPS